MEPGPREPSPAASDLTDLTWFRSPLPEGSPPAPARQAPPRPPLPPRSLALRPLGQRSRSGEAAAAAMVRARGRGRGRAWRGARHESEVQGVGASFGTAPGSRTGAGPSARRAHRGRERAACEGPDCPAPSELDSGFPLAGAKRLRAPASESDSGLRSWWWPLTRSVTPGKSLSFPEPLFPHREVGSAIPALPGP